MRDGLPLQTQGAEKNDNNNSEVQCVVIQARIPH